MRSNYLKLFLPILFIMSCGASENRTNAEKENLNKLKNDIQNILNESGLVGVGIGIVKNEKIIFTDGFGYANLEDDVKYSDRSIQPIGSVSKLFIGLAIAKAIELGHFNLQTNINEILPYDIVNPKFPTEKININHLITHTSSITDSDLFWSNCYFTNDTTANDRGTIFLKNIHDATVGEIPSLKELITNYFKPNGKWFSNENFISSKPGKTYEYSNVGSSLAAYLIEVKTGMSFKEFCKENIFKPLKLKNTNWQKPKDVELASTLYLDKKTPLPTFQLSSYPDGGLNTTTEDLTIFLLEMIKGFNKNSNLLKQENFNLLFNKKFVTFPKEHVEGTNSGIFWDWMKSKRLGHNGADPGLFTTLSFNPDPENRSGFIILLNKNILGTDDWKEHYRSFLQIQKLLIDLEKSEPLNKDLGSSPDQGTRSLDILV